jgi:hypothetical protein
MWMSRRNLRVGKTGWYGQAPLERGLSYRPSLREGPRSSLCKKVARGDGTMRGWRARRIRAWAFQEECDDSRIPVHGSRSRVSPRLRRVLYCAIHLQSDSRHAGWQAGRGALRAVGRRSALRDFRETRTARLLFRPAAANRDVRRVAPRGAGLAYAARNADIARMNPFRSPDCCNGPDSRGDFA